MILSATECDVVNEVICAPANVNELFEFPTIFTIGGFEVTRTIILMFLAAFVAVGNPLFRAPKAATGTDQVRAAVEGMVGFVRDGIACDVIGPEGTKYVPYLMAMFFFLLVGNLFEVTPLINFPITSRMAIPAFLALVTYVIFMVVGFAEGNSTICSTSHLAQGGPDRPAMAGGPDRAVLDLHPPADHAGRPALRQHGGRAPDAHLCSPSGVIFVAAIPEIGVKGTIGVFWFGPRPLHVPPGDPSSACSRPTSSPC